MTPAHIVYPCVTARVLFHKKVVTYNDIPHDVADVTIALTTSHCLRLINSIANFPGHRYCYSRCTLFSSCCSSRCSL